MAVKVTVNMPEDTVDALRRLAFERQTTLTEVIRDAIATEQYLDEQVANGGKILIEARPKTIKEVVFRQMGKRRPASADVVEQYGPPIQRQMVKTSS